MVFNRSRCTSLLLLGSSLVYSQLAHAQVVLAQTLDSLTLAANLKSAMQSRLSASTQTAAETACASFPSVGSDLADAHSHATLVEDDLTTIDGNEATIQAAITNGKQQLDAIAGTPQDQISGMFFAGNSTVSKTLMLQAQGEIVANRNLLALMPIELDIAYPKFSAAISSAKSKTKTPQRDICINAIQSEQDAIADYKGGLLSIDASLSTEQVSVAEYVADAQQFVLFGVGITPTEPHESPDPAATAKKITGFDGDPTAGPQASALGPNS